MTIREYLDDLQATGNAALAEEMQNAVNVWSNKACRGYCIAAMGAAGFSRDQISGVLDELQKAFDEISVDDAARITNV